MIQVVYTNSNCKDLWEMFEQQTQKHSTIPTYLISDIEPNNIGIYKDVYIYSNDMPYYSVWINALRKFNVEHFIYLQEDFILYDNINEFVLYQYLEFLKTKPEYSFIRLLKSGYLLTSNKSFGNLYEIESNNRDIFAMQASIWKTTDYIKLLDEVKENKWLENYTYREAAIKLNIKGLYHYDGENKRGFAHYDSNVFPYIATALVRGKWNFSEYQLELEPILKKYNIDHIKRGIY